MSFKYAVAQRPARGETVCGDAYAVVSEPVVNIAVADGLGHGPLAHEASEGFCDYVRRSMELGLEQLVRRASEAISKTRGAAAAVARVDEQAGTLAFAGVGNIELQAISREPIRPVSTPGIVGRPLRKVVVYRYEISPGDLIALYSDGISSRFELSKYRSFEPQQIADEILERHGKHHDDATVLVIEI